MLPWVFAFCGVLVVISLWAGVKRNEQRRIRQDTQLTAEQVRYRLEAWVDARASVIRLFAGQSETRRSASAHYATIASRVIGFFPGFQALNFVNAEGVILDVMPKRGNEAALGQNLHRHPHRGVRAAVAYAAATGELTAGPVIDLYQGGLGLTTYQAMRDSEGRLSGFVNGVFRIDRLVDACLAESALRQKFRFRLRSPDGRVIYLSPTDDGEEVWPLAVSTGLAFFGQPWQLELAPSPEYLATLDSPTDEVLALVGLLLIVTMTVLMISHFRGLDRLAESQERYRLLVENVRDMIIKIDNSGHLLYVSPSYCEAFGMTEQELLGREFMPLVHEDDRAETARQMAKLSETPHVCYVEQRAMTREGWRWLAWSNTAVLDAGGGIDFVIGVGRDISARKELEEQLRQSQRLQAVGQLAGGIAHDFNNILQAILGNLSFVMEDLPPDHPCRGDLDIVQKSAERAGELTRQLLAFGRQQVLRPVNLDVNARIADYLKLLRRVIGEGIALEFRPGEPLGPVFADPGQFEQVIMNLCVNARDAIGLNGRLLITTEEKEFAAPPAGADLVPGIYVVCEVSDDGIGMDEAVLARIFDPFFTTKSQGYGTGLGLATVYGIVRQHGGHIAARSEPGAGSTFTVYLPRATGVTKPEAAASTEVVSGGRETVLVAEDDEAVRNFVVRALRTVGYTVLAACNGLEAIALAEENPEGVDLLLLDVVMPDLDGPAAAKRILELIPDVCVVFASGYAPGDQLDDEALSGAPFITKPYKLQVLLRTLRECLDR